MDSGRCVYVSQGLVVLDNETQFSGLQLKGVRGEKCPRMLNRRTTHEKSARHSPEQPDQFTVVFFSASV